MRLTPANAAKLTRLDAGESLPKSQLAKAILQPLQQAGAVPLEPSGSSYVIRGIPGKVAHFAEYEWGIRDLRRLAEATPENRDRESLATSASDSKALPNQPLNGIFIRSFGGCFLGDQPLGVTPTGSAILITPDELPNLRVQSDNLIGIENPRCLWFFEKARRHFPELRDVDYTLVLRWHWGNAWRQWLKQWKGQMLYFGDYDPAGLRIFATEVLPHQPEARFLIPENFASLLDERGSRKLFLRQEKLIPFLKNHSDCPGIALVLQHLKETRKALEQESLLF